jgi:hypothetical protein
LQPGSPIAFIFISGAGNMIRTRDLLITNQLLYQLSYTGIFFLLFIYLYIFVTV